MSESATEQPQDMAGFVESIIVDESGPDLELGGGEGAAAEQVEDTATSESDSPSGEAEVEDPVAAEVDPDADEEVDAGEATGDEPDDAGTVEAQGEPEEEPGSEGEDAAAEPDAGDPDAKAQPDVQWREWVGKADGEEIRVPGAVISEQGLFIPAEALPRLQSNLANRGQWERERNTLERKLQEKSGAEAEAEAIIAHVKGFYELQTDDEKWQWLENLKSGAPAVLAEAKAAREKARADSLESERTERSQAEFWQRFENEEAPERITRAVEKALTYEKFKDLGLDRDDVLAAVKSKGLGQLFLRAEEDTDYYGQPLKKGDIVLNAQAVLEVVEHKAEVARARKEAQAATEAAKRKNDEAKGPKKRKAPPAIRATGTPEPHGRERKQPDSRESWEDSLFVSLEE